MYALSFGLVNRPCRCAMDQSSAKVKKKPVRRNNEARREQNRIASRNYRKFVMAISETGPHSPDIVTVCR